ncbi:MAG: sodium:solute symporter family protein [Clostridia bacterium]|jgi:SSS family solute:Na+ symporter|nr:sodium:solute symporter family protein [Clostridia bacterium]MDD4666265.1 sodium:solute symporter family protein [Clostridia bacterium]
MTLEIIVILIYMAGMFGIGIYFSSRVKNTEDFYLSSRSLPTPVIMLTFAATYIGAASTLAKSGLAYKVGFPAVGLTLACCFGLYAFSIISPRIRRIGAQYNVSSIPDLINRRFGKGASLLAAVIIIWTLVGTIGSQMVATTRILEIICEPWGMSYELAAVISVFVIVVYTMISGMYGVAYTDMIQAGILILLIGICLPIVAVSGAGGWSHMTTTLPASFFTLKPDMTLFGMMWVYLLYFLSGPPYWQRAFAAKSEKGARSGVFWATTIILVYTFSVTIVGMAAAVIYPVFPAGISHESLIPMISRQMYHPLFSALVMAAIVAVLMSTIDSYLINAAQTLISDLYKVLRPGVTEEHLLKMGKWAVVLMGVLSIFFTLNIRNILNAIIFAMTFFSSAVSIPALASLYWKKATKQGIISGMITGLVVATTWAKILHKPMGIHEAIPGGILCLIVVVCVSLATYDENNPAPFLD